MISTIPYLLEQISKEMPEKLALVQAQQSITFEDLNHEVISTAQVLKQLGIVKGDRVGVCMGKTIDQAIAILAVLYTDAILVPILPKLKYDNISHIVNDSGMSAVIVDKIRVEEIRGIVTDIPIIVGHGTLDDDFPLLPYLRRHVTVPVNKFSCIGADTAAIIYSSGSTGRPKGIVISHRNFFDGARCVADYLNTNENDRIAGILSFNFDYGLNQLWQVIYKGATLYLHDFVFPNDLFNFISENQITSLPLMPVIISKMFDHRFYSEGQLNDYSGVNYVCTSGGRISQKMVDDLKEAFPKAKIYSMYGLTEAFRSTYLLPEQLELRPTSIGKAMPDVEVYVLDEEENICPPNVAGELVHRGACIAKGYWNAPEQSSNRFRQTSLFPGETVVFSGDLVRTDEDGYLYFIGRKDSMIKTHGYRVSPTEVEEEANKYLKVTASVAFGVENDEIGEDIVLVYTSSNNKAVNEKLFVQFLKRELPSHMLPKHLFHVESFSSTGNEGKIDRQRVYEKIINQLAD